jgi:hypothetical protein
MTWTDAETALYTVYYIIGVISIIGNVVVVAYLLRLGKLSTPFTYLVFFLHLSIVSEEIVTLPYLFSGNEVICIIAEFVHYYSVLVHLSCIGLLVQAYRANLFDNKHSKECIKRYGLYVISLLILD